MPSATAMAVSSVTATVAQYGAFIQGSDLLELAAIDPIVQEYTEVLGEHAGDTIDQLVRDVMAAGTNVRYASTAGSRGGVGSGMTLTSTEIRKAVRTLKAQNARPQANGNYVAIMHPNTEYDVYGDSTIQNAFHYAASRGAENPMFLGELGSWMGCSFVQSTNAKIQASLGLSGQDVYCSLFLGRDAYGVTEIDGMTLQTYFKPKGSAGVADPLDQIWTLGWKTSLAAVLLNNAWLCRVEHVVSP